MARVSVEQRAFSDPRFTILAMKLGCDKHSALGRTLLIWNECQETEKYCLDRAVISALLEHEDGWKFFIESGLGEESSRVDGHFLIKTVRIKGTEGRIEWLGKAREAGKRGGRPKNHTVIHTDKDIERVSKGKSNPPAPALAPAPVITKEKKDSRFAPPSLQEVKEYWKKKGFTPIVEAEKFFNYYESNGWKVGKNQMRSWTHAASGWNLRNNPGIATTQDQKPFEGYTEWYMKHPDAENPYELYTKEKEAYDAQTNG